MKLIIPSNATDKTALIFVQDSSKADGSGLTGLVYNSASLTCYYCRPGSAAAQLALATQTVTGAHSDGGFVEIDATNMPGFYRLDFSDAIIASGVDSAGIMLKGAANMAPVTIEIQLGVSANVSSMNNDTITAAAIATDAIDADAIADNAINAGAIATGAITSAKFAAGAIDAAAVADGAIDAATFAAGAINAAAIADGAIDAATFAAGSIDAAAIADNAIDAGSIATGAITNAKFAAGAIDAAAIANGAIDAATFAAGAIDAAAIATGAIDADSIAADAITADKIADNAIGADQIADNAIDAGAIAADAITAAKIADDAIGADQLATDAIGADQLAASALAEINTEVDTALVDIRLDELIFATSGAVDPAVGSMMDLIMNKDGSQTFDQSTDSLEAIVDSGSAGLTMQNVRDSMKLAPTAGAPAAGSVDDKLDIITIDTDEIQGKLPTNYIMGSSVVSDKDDEIDAIKAVTDLLPNAGALTDIDTGVNNIEAKLPTNYIMGSGVVSNKDDEIDAIAIAAVATANKLPTNYIMGSSVVSDKDDEIDAIKAVTDLLPNSGALTTMSGEVTAIKAQTDKLGFDGSDYVEARVKATDDIGLSTTQKADVNAEVDTSIADARLDELISATAGAVDPAAGSIMDQVMNKDGSQTFDQSTDSLEALAGATSGLTQQQVRDAMQLAPTSYTPATNSVDKKLDDIQTVTDNLPDSGALTTMSGEVTAIKDVTDLLPNAGALTDIDTGVNAVEAKLPTDYIMGSAVLTSKDGTIDLIKTKVDANLDVVLSTRASQTSVDLIQNNTRVRIDVPSSLQRPESGSKTYRFTLGLYDEIGNPEAPDSAPTIKIDDIGGGVVIVETPMTQFGAEVGQYYYDYVITSASDLEVQTARFKVIENAVTTYHRRSFEISEYGSELATIAATIGTPIVWGAGDATIADMLKSLADSTVGTSYVPSEDSLRIIRGLMAKDATVAKEASLADITSVLGEVKAQTDLMNFTGDNLDVNVIAQNGATEADTGVNWALLGKLVLAMVNGKFIKNYPSTGKVTFFERDNNTPLFEVTLTEIQRTRTMGP